MVRDVWVPSVHPYRLTRLRGTVDFGDFNQLHIDMLKEAFSVSEVLLSQIRDLRRSTRHAFERLNSVGHELVITMKLVSHNCSPRRTMYAQQRQFHYGQVLETIYYMHCSTGDLTRDEPSGPCAKMRTVIPERYRNMSYSQSPFYELRFT